MWDKTQEMGPERLSSDPPVSARRRLLLTFQRKAKRGDNSLRCFVKVQFLWVWVLLGLVLTRGLFCNCIWWNHGKSVTDWKALEKRSKKDNVHGQRRINGTPKIKGPGRRGGVKTDSTYEVGKAIWGRERSMTRNFQPGRPLCWADWTGVSNDHWWGSWGGRQSLKSPNPSSRVIQGVEGTGCAHSHEHVEVQPHATHNCWWILRNGCSPKLKKTFPYVFFQKPWSFNFYGCVYNTS